MSSTREVASPTTSWSGSRWPTTTPWSPCTGLRGRRGPHLPADDGRGATAGCTTSFPTNFLSRSTPTTPKGVFSCQTHIQSENPFKSGEALPELLLKIHLTFSLNRKTAASTLLNEKVNFSTSLCSTLIQSRITSWRLTTYNLARLGDEGF